jgi:hypothetical protein
MLVWMLLMRLQPTRKGQGVGLISLAVMLLLRTPWLNWEVLLVSCLKPAAITAVRAVATVKARASVHGSCHLRGISML